MALICLFACCWTQLISSLDVHTRALSGTPLINAKQRSPQLDLCRNTAGAMKMTFSSEDLMISWNRQMIGGSVHLLLASNVAKTRSFWRYSVIKICLFISFQLFFECNIWGTIYFCWVVALWKTQKMQAQTLSIQTHYMFGHETTVLLVIIVQQTRTLF